MTNINSLENQLKEKTKLKMELEHILTNTRYEIEVAKNESVLNSVGVDRDWYHSKTKIIEETKLKLRKNNDECRKIRSRIKFEKRNSNKNHLIRCRDRFLIAAESILDEETYSKILKKAEEIDINKEHKKVEFISVKAVEVEKRLN